jgi:hypothetical protein
MTDEAIKTTLETMLEFEAIENRIKNNNFEIGDLLLTNDQNIIFTAPRKDYVWDVTNKNKYRKTSYNLKVSHTIVPSNSIEIRTQVHHNLSIIGLTFDYEHHINYDGGLCVKFILNFNHNDFTIKNLINLILEKYYNEIKRIIENSLMTYKFSNLNDIKMSTEDIIQMLQDLVKISTRHYENIYQLNYKDDNCELIPNRIK